MNDIITLRYCSNCKKEVEKQCLRYASKERKQRYVIFVYFPLSMTLLNFSGVFKINAKKVWYIEMNVNYFLLEGIWLSPVKPEMDSILKPIIDRINALVLSFQLFRVPISYGQTFLECLFFLLKLQQLIWCNIMESMDACAA